MTVLQSVSSNAQQFAQAWVDALQGLTGILTAPLASNRNPASATKTAAKSAAKETYSQFLDGVVFVPSVAGVHYLISGDKNKSMPRRLGEGLTLGVVLYTIIWVARGWMP